MKTDFYIYRRLRALKGASNLIRNAKALLPELDGYLLTNRF